MINTNATTVNSQSKRENMPLSEASHITEEDGSVQSERDFSVDNSIDIADKKFMDMDDIEEVLPKMPTAAEDLKNNVLLRDLGIELNMVELSDDILVAMKERKSEMRELIKLNSNLFQTIKNELNGERYKEFINVVLSERCEINDKNWMALINEYLRPTPYLYEKFKDLAGYVEDYTEMYYEENDWSVSGKLNGIEENTLYSSVRKLIKEDNPQMKITLNSLYFDLDEYHCFKEKDELKKLMYDTEMDDEEWEFQISEFFDPYPELLDKLKSLCG